MQSVARPIRAHGCCALLWGEQQTAPRVRGKARARADRSKALLKGDVISMLPFLAPWERTGIMHSQGARKGNAGGTEKQKPKPLHERWSLRRGQSLGRKSNFPSFFVPLKWFPPFERKSNLGKSLFLGRFVPSTPRTAGPPAYRKGNSQMVQAGAMLPEVYRRGVQRAAGIKYKSVSKREPTGDRHCWFYDG